MSPNQSNVIEAKLHALNLVLEPPPVPSGHYASYKKVAPLLYLSGVTPKSGGSLKFKGKIGSQLTKEEGYQAARQCLLNQLSTIQAALGSLDKVGGIVKLQGYINAAEDFCELPYVLNGASDLLVEVFGERGKHARSAIGVAALPGGAAVEIELIVQYEE